MKNFFFLFIAFAVLTGCSKKTKTALPTTEDITESVYASGGLTTMNQYTVVPIVSGIIRAVKIQSGDSVQIGDTLFLLSNEGSRLQTENAQLAADYFDYSSNASKLQELKTAIDIAKEKMIIDSNLFHRQKNLWAQQIGSKTELEQRELAYKNSTSQYRSAILRYNDLNNQIRFNSMQSKKNLEISKKNESDFIIRSEINGMVYSVLRKKGELVGPQSQLAIIGDTENFLIELQVDEYDIVRITKGQTVLISMDAYKGQTFEAVISRIDPIMNERTRTFLVEAVFVRKPEVLYPNLTLEANIIIRKKENVLTIPRECLLNGKFVTKKNGEKVEVVTGLMDYRKVEITAGLSANDEIIVPEQ